MIETAYEKYMLENGVKFDELPEDAKVAIREVKKAINIINMNVNAGRKLPPSAMNKLKAMDKFALREVMDFVEQKDTAGTAPFKAEDVKDDIKDAPGGNGGAPSSTSAAATAAKKDDTVVDVQPDATGVAIDKELEALFKSGKLTYTFAELKASAPTTEGVLFKSYTPGGENGLETSFYALIEGDNKEVFTLTKK